MNAKHTGATKLPNQPKMSATDLKKAFDAPSKDVIAPKFNGLIDELEASTAAINIGAVTPAGVRTTIQEALNAKGDMKSADYDAERKVIDAGGIVSYVSAAIVSRVPTDLKQLNDDSEHRLVTDEEKAGWDAKADTTDIPTNLSELNDDSTHRLVTDTEKIAWNAKANVSAIPVSLSQLGDDSTHRVVTDTEKTTWNGKSTVSISPALTSGVRIASVVIDSVSSDIYAPEGGAGSGDMKKSDYDADQAVKNAGGIKAYVSSQISTAITSALTASY